MRGFTSLLAYATLGLLSSQAAGAEAGYSSGDLGHAFAALLIFGLLLAVLGKYAWRPILQQLKDREQYIADSIDKAQQRDRKSQELLDAYKAKLQAAEAEVRQLVADAQKQAMAARERLMAETHEQSSALLEQAQREIKAAQDEAISDLKSSTAALAVGIAESLLAREISAQDHERLTRQSIDLIRSQESQ